jgi:hypothetical protein
MTSPFDLPEGYDDQSYITLSHDNRIIVTHPDLPPMIFDEKAGRYETIKPTIPTESFVCQWNV